MHLHCLGSPSRSACEPRVGSILLTTALSDFDNTANMTCVHKVPGRTATVKLMHFPATRSRVRNDNSPASRYQILQLVKLVLGHAKRGRFQIV